MKEIGGFSILLQLGWVVALAVLLPLGAGLLIDARASTSPLFALIGALLGIVIASIGVVRVATHSLSTLSSPADAGATDKVKKEDEA